MSENTTIERKPDMKESENDNNAADGSVESSDLLAIATAALERIAKCEDAPDIDATGECQTGLYCGVEDLGILDRYQGADYGHAVGVEKALEWASNVAKHALGQMTSEPNCPPPTDPRFARFGEAVWKYIIVRTGSDFFSCEISEDILPLAAEAGLCCRIPYDPELHGEKIDAEPGDEIWWWGRQEERAE